MTNENEIKGRKKGYKMYKTKRAGKLFLYLVVCLIFLFKFDIERMKIIQCIFFSEIIFQIPYLFINTHFH